MALIQVNLFSRSLMRTVPVNVILPVDKMIFPGMKAREDKPYKTLFLLHGIFGNYTDWVTGTRIQRFAEEHDLCVVMPSGDNAFYVNQEGMNNNYEDFVAVELVALMRKMFPLSHDKEDTFIGGLSMGGYGAMRLGLKYCDTFGYIVSLSGAFNMEEMTKSRRDADFILHSRNYLEAVFGDLAELLQSDKNPMYLAKQMHAAGTPFPKVYMACGENDSLLSANREMAQVLKDCGCDLTFEIDPGAHEWDFWDSHIKRGIEWLPTEGSNAGVSSGNVGI